MSTIKQNDIFQLQRLKPKDAIEFPPTLLQKAIAHEFHFKKQKPNREFKIHKNDTNTLCLIQRIK